MMKLLAAFAVMFVVVTAQDEVVVPQCYEGEIINGVENITMQDCGGEGRLCQTKIEVNHAFKKVTKMCKQSTACMRDTDNNGQNCYSESAIEKQVRVCFYCCEGNLCNASNDILVLLPLEPGPVVP